MIIHIGGKHTIISSEIELIVNLRDAVNPIKDILREKVKTISHELIDCTSRQKRLSLIITKSGRWILSSLPVENILSQLGTEIIEEKEDD